MSTINSDVLIGTYATLAFMAPIYPLLCLYNDTVDNGNGYFYLIPQILLPLEQRPHASDVSWPGILPLLNVGNNSSSEPEIESHDSTHVCEPEPEPEPEPESQPEPEPEPEPQPEKEPELDYASSQLFELPTNISIEDPSDTVTIANEIGGNDLTDIVHTILSPNDVDYKITELKIITLSSEDSMIQCTLYKGHPYTWYSEDPNTRNIEDFYNATNEIASVTLGGDDGLKVDADIMANIDDYPGTDDPHSITLKFTTVNSNLLYYELEASIVLA